MKRPISSGSAKITKARSPIMPAGMIAGALLSGLSSLESVLKREIALPRSRRLAIHASTYRKLERISAIEPITNSAAFPGGHGSNLLWRLDAGYWLIASICGNAARFRSQADG